jgi:hypothetical protein
LRGAEHETGLARVDGDAAAHLPTEESASGH